MVVEAILPTDIIIEIFSRLPSKSIARFRCLSKLWASTLSLTSPYFTELFLTQSTTRPRLVFAVKRDGNKWCLYSSPQPQISDKNSNSSLSITTEFHMSLPESGFLNLSAPILGLIYCDLGFGNSMLCNPSTRHLLQLPKVARTSSRFFGYDPIDKQFSVLAIIYSDSARVVRHQIVKLGSGKLSWRDIKCPLHHHAQQFNICINGILYYIASVGIGTPRKIACFDLNSEEFKFIDQPFWPDEPDLLVNFKGKLSGINTKWVNFISKKRYNLKLTIKVLEDIEKQKWSKHEYVLSFRWNKKHEPYHVVGVTRNGDVVLSLRFITDPFCVYFYNLEKNILRKVEIKSVEAFNLHSVFKGCVDYVEDLKDLNWS